MIRSQKSTDVANPSTWTLEWLVDDVQARISQLFTPAQ